MKQMLRVGVCELDITPPVGTALAGSTGPRQSKGIQYPLLVKAIVLESGGTRIAYVIVDLIGLLRKEGDKAVKLASIKTGIPQENIVWAASHTHSGPYTLRIFGEESVINKKWLATIPEKIAECVARADKLKTPALMSRTRGYCTQVQTNRRFRFKDGREINHWLINRGEDELQCVGAAGPIDPEIGIISFEGLKGRLMAVLFHFTMHANTNFCEYFSGDYPAVVAARLAEKYGKQCLTLFMPGASGDINPGGGIAGYRNIGNILADTIISKLDSRRPFAGKVPVGAVKREVIVPYRDLDVDQKKRIRDSLGARRDEYSERVEKVFLKELEIMRKEGTRETATVLQAWRIGEIGFASLPGEPFVEWGIKIKQESPFPWTYPVELGGDYLGYLVTEKAWQAGGYESLICSTAKPSVEGVVSLVDNALEMLNELYRQKNNKRGVHVR